jgi:predicted metal-dependent RNase
MSKFVRNMGRVIDEYDEEDVRRVPTLAVTCRFGERETLPFANASVTFFEAGHILGASSVLIEMPDGRRIFVSGDFASFDQFTVPAAKWPDSIGEVDLLVMESTYGKKVHAPFDESRRDLISFVNQTIAGNGSVILASFGLGRAQELLSLLLEARENGNLSSSVPINVDGMIKLINPIYEQYGTFDVPVGAFNEVSGEGERKEILFAAERTPQIIVTTSGMLNGGPVIEYAKELLPNSRHRIVLTGYQDEGAPSRSLKDLERFGGGPRNVEFTNEHGDKETFQAARPAKLVGLSSHADRVGLVEYASKIKPRVIALVHGEPDAQKELSFHLEQIHERAEIYQGSPEVDVR